MDETKRYRITHWQTGERHEVEAPSAQEACEALGWRIGWCHVRELADVAEPQSQTKAATEVRR